MAGLNKVMLIGNLGADPEIKVMQTGTKMARLRIATSETYTDKQGERITNTEWHTVVLWRVQAEIAEKYLTKGKQIFVEGKLRTRSWEDQDGNMRYATEIQGDSFTMLGGRSGDAPNDNSENTKPSAQEMKPKSGDDDTADDLPF